MTVRRRVFLRGEVTVSHAAGANSILSVGLTVDGSYIGGLDGSGLAPSKRVTFGVGTGSQVSVEPGAHVLRLQMTAEPAQYAIRFTSAAQIVDADTSEQVATVQLENKQVAFDTPLFGGPKEATWSVVIDSYTS